MSLSIHSRINCCSGRCDGDEASSHITSGGMHENLTNSGARLGPVSCGRSDSEYTVRRSRSSIGVHLEDHVPFVWPGARAQRWHGHLQDGQLAWKLLCTTAAHTLVAQCFLSSPQPLVGRLLLGWAEPCSDLWLSRCWIKCRSLGFTPSSSSTQLQGWLCHSLACASDLKTELPMPRTTACLCPRLAARAGCALPCLGGLPCRGLHRTDTGVHEASLRKLEQVRSPPPTDSMWPLLSSVPRSPDGAWLCWRHGGPP